MEITFEQYQKIAKYLPVQRGNVQISNLQLINAILYVAENGCKWRALPEKFGSWHTVYVRLTDGVKTVFLNVSLKAYKLKELLKSE